jgi:hypothetical protein
MQHLTDARGQKGERRGDDDDDGQQKVTTNQFPLPSFWLLAYQDPQGWSFMLKERNASWHCLVPRILIYF